jgi:hypothetical protein
MNPQKSTALPVGQWTFPPHPLGITLQPEVRILGVDFMASTREAMADNWKKVVNAVRAQASQTYQRDLDYTQGMTFVQMYLLAKIWYIAQIFPVPRQQAQRITAICACYLWQGSVFRVPAHTLQLPKADGGWDLPDVECKCLTVLYNRINKLRQNTPSLTQDLMHALRTDEARINPPGNNLIPPQFPHLRKYANDMAYLQPETPGETERQFKHRVYATLATMHRRNTPVRHIRIHEKSPKTPWRTVWKNVQQAPISSNVKAKLYLVIHDVIPNNDRLHSIHLTASPNCSSCGA